LITAMTHEGGLARPKLKLLRSSALALCVVLTSASTALAAPAGNDPRTTGLVPDLGHNAAAAAPAVLPLISRNVPAFTNNDCGGGAPARLANDTSYDTQWRSCDVPLTLFTAVYLAYDLSSVAPANRSHVLVAWYNDPATVPYDHTFINVHPCCASTGIDIPSDYTIEGNAAPGGGAYPTAGWVIITSVSGNHYHSRQHLIDFTGYNWLRINVTGSDGSPGASDARMNLDVHDASGGAQDDWIFFGDSIIQAGLEHNSMSSVGGSGTWAQLINAANPSYFPAFEDGGIGGTVSQDGVNGINTWLPLFAGHFVGLAYGTNDAGFQVTPTDFYNNYVTMVQAILTAGKIPVVPMIPWGCTTSIQQNAPALNQKIVDLYAAYPQIVHGPDFWAYFQANQSLIGSDCVHPTAPGQVAYRQQWANAMLANVYGSGSSTTTTTTNVVSGAGAFTGTAGSANFGFKIRQVGTAVSGHLNYSNKSDGVTLSCPVSTLSISGNSATFGNSGGSCTYQVTVQDNGKPGAGKDTFNLTSSTETNGGTLKKGDIAIRIGA
jgi:hypothetical protein